MAVHIWMEAINLFSMVIWILVTTLTGIAEGGGGVITVDIRGDDSYILYADGTEKDKKQDYANHYNVSIPEATTILAAYLEQYDQWGILHVDVGDPNVFWRCVRDVPLNPADPVAWTRDSYFDFHWPQTPHVPTLFLSDNGKDGDQVFCRTRLGNHKLEVAGSGCQKLIFYSDGAMIQESDGGGFHVSIPGNSSVLAVYVMADAYSDNPGFKICDNHFAHTDLRDFEWLCTNQAPEYRAADPYYWTENSYDDSQWKKAMQVGSPDDHLIWSADPAAANQEVYCRLRLVRKVDYCLRLDFSEMCTNSSQQPGGKQPGDGSNEEDDNDMWVIIGLAIALGIITLSAVGLLVCLLLHRRKSRPNAVLSEGAGVPQEGVSTVNRAYAGVETAETAEGRLSDGYEQPHRYISPVTSFYEKIPPQL